MTLSITATVSCGRCNAIATFAVELKPFRSETHGGVTVERYNLADVHVELPTTGRLRLGQSDSWRTHGYLGAHVCPTCARELGVDPR